MEIKGLKKKLDDVFSLFIRLRDCDKDGIVTCCTCGARKHYRQVDAGHYITRGDYATRWTPENVAAQCKRCNLRGGEQHLFAKFIDKTYGVGTADMLQIKRHNTFKLSGVVLEALIEEYQQKVKKLRETKKVK